MVELARALRAYEDRRDGKPSEWGPPLWGLLHGLAESIPCDTCRTEGRLLMSAVHDTVNAHLGKPIKDPPALCTVAAQIGAVASSYRECHLERFVRCAPGGFE